MFTRIHLNKVLIIAALFSAFGLAVLAQENSSISVVQRFPGQYDNIKFSIYLADPEGIGGAQVVKAGGGWLVSAGRSCLKSYYTGTVTLLPEDFPLKASLTDCQGEKYETSVWPPGTFPIAELGNCQNENDCKNYCDVPANAAPCLDYAEVHRLLTQKEIDEARQMIGLVSGGRGPGGCQTESDCESYCDDPGNMEECIVFARDNGLLSPEELEEVEMVLQAIRQGATPPNCRGKTECDAYCSREENLQECLDFGTAAGFVSPEEAEMIRKTGGKGPGGCTGRDTCESYCNEPNNMEECFNFALQYGLIPPEEAEKAMLVLKAIKRGITPPNCRGEDECEVYCSQPGNMNECMDFAAAAGFMTKEEAEMAKKTGGLGPGGCRGEKECNAFCEDPANEETCFRFGLEHGFVSEEQLAEMRGGAVEMRRSIDEAPTEVTDCIKSRVSQEMLQGLYDGSLLIMRSVGEELGSALENCYQASNQEQGRQAGEQIRQCLAMPCQDALPCLESVAQDEAPSEGEEAANEITALVQEKVQSCVQTEMQQPSPKEHMPSLEEIESIEEMMKEQFMQQLLEEEEVNDCDGSVDEDGICTGAFLDPWRIFMANISTMIGF